MEAVLRSMVGSTLGSRGGGGRKVEDVLVRKARVGSTVRLGGGRKVVLSMSTQWSGMGIWLMVRKPTGSTSTFRTEMKIIFFS